MMSPETLAMVLFSAIAVYLAYTKCPCSTVMDEPTAFDPPELPSR